ncbi:hypothetical protein [Nguyenibacter sp. L1]|jgi:hypothetical protein|uniref:hypothetical protein n=1 Tax=Nguyenibacter sp. L1 TaxID=3049350 RepID=UPI002B45F26E|nr:hypothetical protein [Nguyenibacter sp. L1]WRH89800.1 hypothetical protein QN315_09495 [Nguyenibacter sp. L1]
MDEDNKSSTGSHGGHGFLIDESTTELDAELHQALITMSQSENQASECNLPTDGIIWTAAIWFAAAIVIWTIISLSI